MCPARKQKTLRSEVLPFTYPKLHKGQKWYVDFYSLDPAEGVMKRKKYHLDGIAKITERRKRAAELIEQITRLLREGWSPWVGENDSKNYIPIEIAIEKYRKYLEKIPKYTTQKSYTAFLNQLEIYMKGMLLKPKYIYQLNTGFFAGFLDYLYYDKEVSARTRNNYRVWCSTFMNFFLEREFCSTNPVEKIKAIPEDPKKRKPLDARMLRRLYTYLKETDPMMLLACRMEYYTFIRPRELCAVRISDISVAKQTVYVSGTDSKNKRDANVGLNRDVIMLMVELGVLSKPGDWYLFGDKLKPGKKQGDPEMFRRKWLKIRKALKWGDEYQFYSLKDSGIRDLANEAGIVVARDQARHTDISTTNKYLQGRDLPVHDETKTFHGEL